jgi:hypothetical protein
MTRSTDRFDSDVEHLGGYRPSKIRRATPPDLRGRQTALEIVIMRLVPLSPAARRRRRRLELLRAGRGRLSGRLDPWFESDEETTELLPGRGSIRGLSFMDPFEGRERKLDY